MATLLKDTVLAGYHQSWVTSSNDNSYGLPVQPKSCYSVEQLLNGRDKYFVAIYEFIRQIQSAVQVVMPNCLA
jgi:hypothetical protein